MPSNSCAIHSLRARAPPGNQQIAYTGLAPVFQAERNANT
jgi:hypothetical protein